MENKNLFEMIRSKGELLEDKLHVIESCSTWDEDKCYYSSMFYRVYHGDGYCFDSYRKRNVKTDQDEYFFYAGWDGFKPLNSATEALILIINHYV